MTEPIPAQALPRRAEDRGPYIAVTVGHAAIDMFNSMGPVLLAFLRATTSRKCSECEEQGTGKREKKEAGRSVGQGAAGFSLRDPPIQSSARLMRTTDLSSRGSLYSS